MVFLPKVNYVDRLVFAILIPVAGRATLEGLMNPKRLKKAPAAASGIRGDGA
jgi:hypothetical protein